MLGIIETDSVLVADFEAGIGTLTRLNVAAEIDVVLVVVEPSAKSLDVGRRLADIARERAGTNVIVVANKLRSTDDADHVREALGVASVVAVPDDPALLDVDRVGGAPLDAVPDSPAVRALANLAGSLLGGV